ncbi:hypothetical protein ACLIXB_003829 [Yersinia enterocolitica]|nr:hypothetical protein [Yersinia enterocolitica]EKN6179407.1 hypothetical protein [Yersinia enterocolitica]EKN6391097.1 hypothetical protein [Yersinia enterocolitica]ELI8120977.1 hypothetical protein [Yersinia enterocolitica]ELI8238928.1 hypothetical protein [Yersinia enterocolitica]
MAIVNELITKFGFIGDLAPQETFNANLKSSIGLLAGMGAAIAGSAAGITGWVTSVSKSIDPLIQFGRETGIAVETIQTLGYAASVNGSSVDALQSSLGEMTKRVGEFVSTGEGEAKDVASRLGLQFKELNGEVKSSDVIFRELADKLHGMSQAEKFSVLDKMGIDRSMVQLLSKTGDEIEALQKKSEALGVVTQDQADQFAAYNDSLTTLGKGFDGIKFQVAIGFVPVLKDLVDGFTDFLIANKDLIKNGLSHLGEIIFSVMGMIRRFLPIVAAITIAFAAWWLVTGGLATVMGVLMSPVVLITAAILGIILVIDDLLTAMEGGKSVIADFFMDNWGIDIVPGLLAIKDVVLEVVDLIIDSFKVGVENIKLMFSALWKLLTGDFEGAWKDVVKIFDNTVELLKKPFMAFIDWAQNIFANLGDYIGNVISNAASSAWNSAKSFIGLGDDEEQSLPAYSGSAGMNGISYGNPGLNGNLAYTPGGGVSNSSVSQSNTIHINTSDPVVAGNTAANGLQQSMRDANRMSGRGGM